MGNMREMCSDVTLQNEIRSEVDKSPPGLLESHPLIQEIGDGVHMGRDYFRMILDECPVSIIAFDSAGVIFFVNNWHLKYLAQQAMLHGAILGQLVWELPSIVNSNVVDRLRCVLSGKAIRLPEVVVPSPVAGHETWQLMHAVPLFKEGNVVAGLLMREDITESKRLEMSLRKAREQAEALTQAQNAFMANMSHELRSPLNGILGMLQLIKGEQHAEEREKCADMGIEAGQRLLSLLNNILDCTRNECRKIHIECKPFSLSRVITDVMKDVTALIRDKGLTLSAEIASEIPEQLGGDACKIRQILQNLVGNAIKFTSAGSVRIAAWPLRSKRMPDKLQVFLAVIDTGEGIPDDMQSKIFERFTQVDVSYARKHSGAGLGLAIVKDLAVRMNGGVDVLSELGVGSTFCVHVYLDLLATR